jgi:hypothetical protein
MPVAWLNPEDNPLWAANLAGQSYDDFTLDGGSGPITITAPAASATFSAPAPGLGRIVITAPAASVVFSAAAPALNRVRINAPSASSTFSAPAPTIKERVRPPAASATFSAARPAVVLDGFKVIVNPAATAAFSAPAPTIILSASVGSIAPVTFTPTAAWRLVIGDLNGRPISVISTLARQKQIVAQLNRPMQASFVVAGDDPRVNSLHSDGLPYLWPGARTMKWYRKEGTAWVLRFAGYIWSINPAERDSDSSVVDIAITCFDPFQRLMKRLCRNAAGSYASTVTFTSTPGATIAKTLVDRTILYGGDVGIATSGTFGGATTPQTVKYDQQFVAQALIDLTNTMTLDLIIQPVDRFDGTLASMGAIAQRGVDRPAVIFGYDAIPHSALGFNRSLSMDEFANDITLYSGPTSAGKKLLSAHRASANSKTTYGTYEDAQVLTEITEQDFLDTIADTEIQLRKNPRDLVAIRPVPGRSPSPWLDWWLGDRIFTEWSNNTGATGSGYQRIYGATIDIADQGFETISELLVSADAESA